MRWSRQRSFRRPARRVAALTLALLMAAALLPRPALAVDLFPVDDWLGDGLKSAGEVVLGPLKVGAEELARLVATTVAALADLLVPKSLVEAGIDGIRWLVQLPPVGTEVSATGVASGVRRPHLAELRGVLTWIAITLLPLGVIVTAGRAFLAPALDTDSPAEVLQRALIAAFGLLVYDWAWGVLTRLVRLLTDALLGLPWVVDGVERMLETLVIGGTAGNIAAAEFVIPLLVLVSGAALLALLLLRVGLEVMTALVYALGGLALGLSVTAFGRRLLAAWLLAAGAVVMVPVLWTIVFVTGAALILDAGNSTGDGFAGFVAQLYNAAAALAVFVVAVKLALGVFRQAGGALSNVATTTHAGLRAAGGARGAAGSGRSLSANATPAGLARFSQRVRGGLAAGTRAATVPLRHPAASARAAGQAVRHPVQTTRAGADALRGALTRSRGSAGTASHPRPTGPVVAAGDSGAARPGVRPGAAAARPVKPGQAGRAASDGHDARASAARPGQGTPRGPARTDGPTAEDARQRAAARRQAVRFVAPRPWWLGRVRVLGRDQPRERDRPEHGGDDG
jgi:hypothetical protein